MGSDSLPSEKRVKAWALVSNRKILLAERCSKKQFLINWGGFVSKDETVQRAEIRLIKAKRK